MSYRASVGALTAFSAARTVSAGMGSMFISGRAPPGAGLLVTSASDRRARRCGGCP